MVPKFSATKILPNPKLKNKRKFLYKEEASNTASLHRSFLSLEVTTGDFCGVAGTPTAGRVGGVSSVAAADTPGPSYTSHHSPEYVHASSREIAGVVDAICSLAATQVA